ncbi:rho GTPase activating protein 22 [Pisolithus orientalis]|uniref:rho GTPase activating protein 22 n=1 Tax=Pisolithus orientalis TaxID=936130 RepID=UPI0022249DD1|nr:rho GTPase activating protein 22 [Pisolithus orientalis]KAI6007556.1 rho GTPase activating protein 22 [Pisolithus orientalis]
MPPRRGASSLSPHDAPPSSTPASPANPHFPPLRSNSPSGLTQFLSKPSKWFGRKPLDTRAVSAANEAPLQHQCQQIRCRPHLCIQNNRWTFSTYPLPRPVQIDRVQVAVSVTFGQFRAKHGQDTPFHDRVREYRNRSNSSATLQPVSPSDSAASASPTHRPFPSTASTVPLSSSPPSDQPPLAEPSISISVSSPTTETFAADEPSTPTTRIHSFAPRLPTKLSASKLNLPATSPKRKESGDSMKDGVGNISTIVYSSGFLNRMADAPLVNTQSRPYSTALNFTLAKGWKPFKSELKGSKLYFYKPPSDRSAAVKELFPTGIVPPSSEEEVVTETEPSEEGGRTSRNREEGTIGRKKRAYWGRRTHPQLIVGEGGVEKGTFEALIHEAVFATTFVLPLSDEENFDQLELGEDRRKPGWKDLSAAVLLCLPTQVDRSKFESEFTRCCMNLVNGADDDTKEVERARVTWLAQEYLRYHKIPSDLPGWEEFKSAIIPDFVAEPTDEPSATKHEATEGVYAQSPGSPRPQGGPKMASLIEALGTPSRVLPASPSSKTLNPKQQRPQIPFSEPDEKSKGWSTLVRDGFTREVLSLLDPNTVAVSLQIFHRRTIEKLHRDIDAAHIFGTEQASGESGASTGQSSPCHQLFGSDDNPHWLTRLLVMQILALAGLRNAILKPPPAAIRVQEVISVWARIGELCRAAGDECSWQAILHALCSRPVARLTKAWKRVDRQSLLAVESWVYPENGGHPAVARVPPSTAWGGDLNEQIRKLLNQASNDGEEHWLVPSMMKARELFNDLRAKVLMCANSSVDGGSPTQDVEKLASFWNEYSQGASGQSAFSLKFQRIDQFMSLSLAAEPRRKGLFEPYFWSQASSEPLPAVSLLERSQIWRGRLESGPTKFSVEELQQIRSLDMSLRSPGSKDKLFNVGDVDLRGTAIPVYDGELIVVARPDKDPGPTSRPASRAPSRPPSSVVDGSGNEKVMTRSPSIRVKPGSSQGLERKSSVARRNSLPSISSRPNPVITEVSSERPIRVLVQAGTLDRLVNVLIHGLQGVSVAVADDNGETSLRDGNTRDLIVDHADFSRVWWTVFRSFVTPIVFFELLSKRFVCSRPSSNSSSGGPVQVLRYQSEILATVKEWVTTGGGGQDCLDDTSLYETARTFLEKPLDRSELDSLPTNEDPELLQAWKALETMKNETLATFISHTLRPPALVVANPRPVNTFGQSRTFGSQVPDIDHVSAEDLVDNLNAMGLAAFSNVTEEDLFTAADLLEVQSADRTGWFTSRDPGYTDDVDIQTMYSHLLDVEPSPMISELSQDSVYRLLPPGIRSCVRAYSILRKWLISKLVAPKLGVRQRQNRMDLCLRVLEIARLRNLDRGAASLGPADRACVRSFVEAVVTAAVLSPESRMHHRPWQNVANIRGVQCDSLTALLSRQTVPKKSYGDALVVDISWLLERILEIVSVPNTVSVSQDNPQCIINLDKRRHLCDLILNSQSLSSRGGRLRDDVDRKDFERLYNIEKEVSALRFDHRSIKDEAQKEALQAQAGGSTPAKKTRPFQRLVAFQQEKNKRDKYLHDRLSKDKKQEQLRNERRDDYLNKAMRPRKPMTQAQKQHRIKKSYSSAFFQLMRPISSAFTDNTHSFATKKTPAELDFTPSGKPSLVLSVVDAKVTQVVNNERSYVFQLDTEDGGHYLLQANSKPEMVRWMDQINKVSKTAAKRRLTYLGNSPKPQLSDHIHDHIVAPSASRHPTAVFGVELDFLLQREAGGADVEPGTIPSVIRRCLYEVESRGLSEVGIYRIAGAASEVNSLREAFNNGEMPITESTDIHAVCDLIKSWFRLMPEPVFPSSAYFGIIEAIKIENLNARLACIRHIVRHLPQANFDLLKRVAEHLDKVTDYEEYNQMTAEALAIVFSPNLLRAPKNDFALILANMAYTHKLVKALITHFHVIFDEDHEGENDAEEDEMEEPILEEDEEDEEDMPSQTVEEE